MNVPHLDYELEQWNINKLVLGIDEVGRGAFAGPVVVGGVIFKKCCSREEANKLASFGINDSKKLTAKKREYLYNIIQEQALFTLTIFTDVDVINSYGIGKATFQGMRKLVKDCQKKNAFSKLQILVDAFFIPNLDGFEDCQTPIIRGDQISLSIAAASIIAKVERDRYMKALALKYPQYGFEKHVGYGTAVHREAIQKLGVLPIHRTAFIRKLSVSHPTAF